MVGKKFGSVGGVWWSHLGFLGLGYKSPIMVDAQFSQTRIIRIEDNLISSYTKRMKIIAKSS